jgi:hypothetical protein
MFTAYIDESGHELKRGWTFLAGFLGDEGRWADFVPKWRKGLGPQRKLLHMHELRWNLDRTRRLLDRLGPIPEQCKLVPVMAGVWLDDYEDLLSDGSEFNKELGAYLTCVHTLAIQVLRVIPDDERLEIVFEEQRQYEPLANRILASAADLGPRTSDGIPKLAKWSFVPKGSTIMTDPSDYFAFALAQIWTDPGSKKTQWCTPILRSNQSVGIGNVLQRDEIRPIIADIVNPMLKGINAE